MGTWQVFVSPSACLLLWQVQQRIEVWGKALPEQVHTQLPFALNGLWVGMWGKASSVIHDKLGEGHSHLCEAAFNVLPRFHAKTLVLHRLTYMTLTNWGLVISCLLFLQEVYESKYLRYVELYTEMELPILDGLAALWTEDMKRRTAHLKQIQTPEAKSYRIHMKSSRVVDQQELKQWAKRQQIQTDYLATSIRSKRASTRFFSTGS